MVHDKVGLPKALHSQGVWDENWKSGDSQCVGGSIWGKDSPAAEVLSSCHCGWWSSGLLLLGGHVDHKAPNLVAVAKFIVIAGNELDKVVIEGNASPGIKVGGVGVTAKVAGDNLILRITQDIFEGAL